MVLRDYRGDLITGATASALEGFEQALAAFQSWRGDPARTIAAVLEAAPGFVMAHVLQGYLLVCTREPASVRAAAPVHENAARLRCNRREQLHVAALGAALNDDYERAKSIFGELLGEYPRDVLALQVAHAFDYLSGDLASLTGRVSNVLSAWSPELPGYHSVLAMHAFGLVEAGEHRRAEAAAREALALDALDARAYHALAHVFEATERPAEGLRWMREHIGGWDGDTTVATHCWWHLALFHLQRGDIAGALSLYDQRIRARHPAPVSDLIDASALLWRIALRNADVGERWNELATDWEPHVTDGFCTFTDLHAMMAFVGARNWGLAARLVSELDARHSMPTRHGATTRLVGLPACRAFLAFGRGDLAGTINLLSKLPPIAHRLGGSHAQRNVIHLTLRAATEGSRARTAPSRLAA